MRLISKADLRWVETVLMPHFSIDRLQLAEDLDKVGDYPDIWVNTSIPRITVTRAWARVEMHERRKRLTHECLHITGMQHGAKERAMGYFSRPDRDTYSMKVYRELR